MPLNPRTDMLLLTIECRSAMSLFDDESSFKFRAEMSLIENGRWLQISFCAIPLALSSKRLQIQRCNISISGNIDFNSTLQRLCLQ